jgi:dGTPase
LAGQPDVQQGAPAAPRPPAQSAQVVCDYVAGMTDRFAIDEYKRLTDLSVPG